MCDVEQLGLREQSGLGDGGLWGLGPGLDEVEASSPDDLSDAGLWDRLHDGLALLERLTALVARDVGEVDRRGMFGRDGYTSMTACLTHAGGMSVARARQLVGLGQLYMEAPTTARAWLEGTVSTDQTRILSAAHTESPEVYAEHEAGLIEAVTGLGVADTRRAVEYWRRAASPGPAAVTDHQLWTRRGLHASRTLEGMMRLDGWADPESAAVLQAMWEAGIGPPGPDDTRSSAQRRLDALVKAARGYLDATGGGSAGRPHLMVHVDPATLVSGVGGGLHETTSGTVLAAETVRRICCDAVLTRIVFGDDRRVLDLGTSIRTVPGWLRRAVTTRDRHCVFPGCDRPPAWCDVHHLIHPGGPTDLDWLVLLCRRHHRLIHQHGYRIHGPAHRLVVTRPDGTTLAPTHPARASPP